MNFVVSHDGPFGGGGGSGGGGGAPLPHTKDRPGWSTASSHRCAELPPLRVDRGRACPAAAAGAPAGVVSAFTEPSRWCDGAVLDAAGCAVCVSAAPSSWRIGGCAGCCPPPEISSPPVHKQTAPPGHSLFNATVSEHDASHVTSAVFDGQTSSPSPVRRGPREGGAPGRRRCCPRRPAAHSPCGPGAQCARREAGAFASGTRSQCPGHRGRDGLGSHRTVGATSGGKWGGLHVPLSVFCPVSTRVRDAGGGWVGAGGGCRESLCGPRLPVALSPTVPHNSVRNRQ